MTPFLKQIAKLFYGMYGAELHRLAFVFPNRRSGIFFRKYLSEVASKPVFSPTVLTINDLFYKLNPKQQADPVKLLFQLYDVYGRRSGSAETFDDFVHWGKMLLNDFDEIDKYLVDAKQLFSNVKDLNDIEMDFSFLQPSQVQAIRSFWASFGTEDTDANRQNFLHIWELLYPIYTDLREMLAAEGLAYEGMIYREVVEKMESVVSSSSLPYEKIVFIGLNALSNAERELLKYLKKQGMADFYWDYSSEKIKDPDNRASYFLKDNLRLFPSAYALPEEETPDTQFELIGIPSRIGQAKQIYPILENLFGHQTITADEASCAQTLDVRREVGHRTITSDEALQTAIVLPDEQLLLPVLHSIPEQIAQINVTLGYSLSGTPTASLMDFLQSLQKNKKMTEQGAIFYHSDVIAVLCHQYVAPVCPDEAAAIIQNINTCNQVYVAASALCITPFLGVLFSAPVNTLELSDCLMVVLKELNSRLPQADDHLLEQEFIFHYYTIVNRIREMIWATQTDMSTDTYFKLLKQMTDYIKIPFHGEPLSGLQVMGTLETRVLDFENLIILSANEGVFPAKSVENSFIPYHLRCGFGLPTPEYQESIRAYHFYRMIYRAKRVIMLYDTRTDGLQSGEVSRYVHQLRYHYKAAIRQKVAVYNVASSQIKPFKVEKDEEVMRALSLYKTEKSLSASAINVYLDCPLKFYFTVIKGIDEEKAVSEMLRHDMFGTLLHRVMELAYKPFCGQTVTSDLLKLVAEEKHLTELIQKAFAKDYFHKDELSPLTGQTYLYGETIRKYACKILEYDRSLTPFHYIDSERLFYRTLAIDGGRKVRLKGYIDRIDAVGDSIRIIDYKSGRPSELTFPSMESLFDVLEKDRRKAVMQVFLYAWVFALETGGKNIQPAVYYVNNLFRQSSFDPAIRQQVEKDKILINRFESECLAFEDGLRKCLNELFNADKPFMPTSVVKHCEYCPFTGICK